MDLYKEIKKVILELQNLEDDLILYAHDDHSRGKRAAYNNAASMLHSLLWDYEESNNIERH